MFSLRAATYDQLITFTGQPYEQTDGLVIGSPLGPLLANVFVCSIEEALEREGKMPKYYERFVDDTLTITPKKALADNFREILNQFKNQASADIIRTQLKDLSQKIKTTVKPVFVSQKIGRDLKLHEAKPPIYCDPTVPRLQI